MLCLKKNLQLIILTLFSLLLITCSKTTTWNEVSPGIWKASFGEKEKVDLLETAGIVPKTVALAKLPETEFPITEEDIDIKIIDGKTYLRFPLDKNEQIYGLGLNFKNLQLRKKIRNLHVDHYGGEDNGRTHAPVPFYVSSKGYGVLINSARYLTVYIGTGVRKDSKNPPELLDRNTARNWDPQPYSDAVEILVPAGGAEILVFSGPKMIDVVRRYNLYSGGGCLPPKWGLGFTHRVPTLYTDKKVMEEIKEFERRNFPLDFVGLEPGWQSMAYPCTYEWDNTRFPDPENFIKDLDKAGVKANLWFNPYVSPKASIYNSIKPFSGSHTVWNGIIPDFTLGESREIFRKHFLKNHIDIGVGGYKIDEVDGFDVWLWPDVAVFPSGTGSEQMRQIYGVMVQKMTSEWFREQNRRTWGLVRGSNAGSSSFPYVIYNDYYSHRDFITALCSSSFSGILWTPEVRSSKTGEEWLRRMQSVCFSPMAMINAWSSGTKPWSFPEVEDEVRETAFMRMRLIPYLYSAFAQYCFEGTPPFKAMRLVDGFEEIEDDTLYTEFNKAVGKEVKDQFVVGDYLLVAPMFAGEKSRKIILPKGGWYDYYTGEYAGSTEIITVTPGLNKIPLFVKDGGIIPFLPDRRHAPVPGEKLPLEIRHYGKAEGSCKLYDDDGYTYDYLKNEYQWRKITISKNDKNEWQGTITPPEEGKPDSYSKISWKFMTK